MRLISPRITIAALAMLTLWACSESTTEQNGGGGNQPAPGPTRVDVAVESRYIRIHGSCDEDAFGNPASGEFHYQVVIVGPGRTVTHGTTDYNSVTATPVSRSAGSNIDFGNRTLTFRNVELDVVVEIRLGLVEWDGPIRDFRMDNRRGRRFIETGIVQDYTGSVDVGSGDCHGELFFDVRIREL